MGGVRLVTQKALHGMSAQRTVSIQEAVHLVDNQDLVLCSETFTNLSLRQGAKMAGTDDKESKDIVTMYRNRHSSLYHLSMDQYFYKYFCANVLSDERDETERTKHRILIPKGQNFKPCFPVTHEYAKGVLIQHMPWSRENPPTTLFSNEKKTIRKFKKMIDNKELPSSVVVQYICAMKYTKQKKLEMLATQGTEQPFNLNSMDEEEREMCIAHQHISHFSDNKFHDRDINGLTVDIGTDIDWTEKTFKERRRTCINGEDWVDDARSSHDSAIRSIASSSDDLVIPKRKDGSMYSVDNAPEQEQIVHAAVDTIVKFLNNDPTYKPMRATIMGCGGTGKSYIINTIIGLVRTLTSSNNTVQIAAPSGAAAFNVQGSTLHSLLSLGVAHPEKPLTELKKEKLKEQLERLLVLVIDERSMISSKILAAAERNVRECIYNGQNSTELWGGLPVVLLFGDDYQLMPVNKDGAIHGYAKRLGRSVNYRTEKMTASQYFSYRGDWLFTEVMTEQVYLLTKNYRVQDEKFKELLEHVRVGEPTKEDAEHIMKLHSVFYRADKQFKEKIENHKKTMWLFAKNTQVQDKNRDKLVDTSVKAKVPVARLDCWFDTNKLQNGTERHAVRSHFETNSYVRHTDLCVGSRVSIKNWNILPSAGLYNGSIGTVIEIVYKDNPIGPNDKENDHLPNYVVVDFPHLNLPPYIKPWDAKHPTVSAELLTNTSSNSSSAMYFSRNLHQCETYQLTTCASIACTNTNENIPVQITMLYSKVVSPSILLGNNNTQVSGI